MGDIGSEVKRRQSKSYKFKEFAKICFIRCANMKRNRRYCWRYRTDTILSTDGQADGQGETSILLRPKTGCCPMTGHRLSQGWPPHIGRSMSVRRLSYDQTSYSTHFRAKTVRFDHSHLISGRGLTAVRIACGKEHLKSWIILCVKYGFVVVTNYFCTKTFLFEKQLLVKYLKTVVDSAVDSMALQHISIDE